MTAALVTENACAHCGTGLLVGQTRFCCTGCATAFEIIQGGGWSAYYQVRAAELAKPVAPGDLGLAFDYLDTEDYRSRHARETETGLEATWYLEGLQCGACSWLVEQVARKQEGVRDASLNFGEGRLTLVCARDTKLSALATILARLGYVAGLVPQAQGSVKGSLLKLGLVGALAANLMLMSVPFYLGLTHEPTGYLFGGLSLLLALPLMGYGAREFFVRAWYSVRHRLPGLDLPIALGLSGALVLSTVNLAAGNFHGMYYDSMGMLVFFLLLGKNAREIGISKAMAAGHRLLARMPQMVEIQRDGVWVQEAATQLAPGDRIRLKAGNVVPVDGLLESAVAVLNLNVVSGESRPVEVARGASLLAGSINLGSEIEVLATSRFSDSRFAQLEAQAQNLQGQRKSLFGNPMAYTFLAFALGSAGLGLALWWSTSPLKAVAVALTVLIVVCPCALALAEPVAEAFALKYAAALGIWIKDQNVFHRLPEVKRVVFDKTGILTDGSPRIVAKQFFVEAPHWLESAIAALESQVNHPLVEAFAVTSGPRLALASVGEVRVVPGAGIVGRVDGRKVAVGSPQRLAALGCDPEQLAEVAVRARLFHPQDTQVCALVDGQLAALFALHDPTRPEIPALCQRLREDGKELTILSGDQSSAVAQVAAEAGIDGGLGEMLPEQKLAYVQAHDPEHTLMVGDGFNDMGALARAGIGLTHAQGSEAALRFATVIFKDRAMGRLADLFDLAATSRKAMHLGIRVSLCYNVLAVVLALRGAIGPLGAAVLMPLSSLSLIAVLAMTFRQRSRQWES